MFFGKKFARPASGAGLTPGALRRIGKFLPDLNDKAQLSHLSDFLEMQNIAQWSTMVRFGGPG